MTSSPARHNARSRAEHLGPERRRPQILDAALRIADEDGISSVTIASIASSLDVTRPVVYACFSGRSEVLSALIDREEQYLAAALPGILRAREVDATEAVFIEGFQALLTAVAARPQAWRLLYGNPDTEVTELFGRGRAIVVARCQQLLAPTLNAWGTVDAEQKLPPLVDFWVSSGEGAVRTLLSSEADHAMTPESLGALIGAAVYRGMRSA